MALNLPGLVRRAEDIGDALRRFLDPVFEHTAEIRGLIGQFNLVSSALRELDEAIRHDTSRRRSDRIADELGTATSSLSYTFQDVKILFGGLARPGLYPGAEYIRVWRNLSNHFLEESQNTLKRRLEIYHLFLRDIIRALTQGAPQDISQFESTRTRIENLLRKQEDRIADDLDRASLDTPPIRRPPSFKRERPADAPRDPGGRRRATGPRSPMEDDFPWFPPAPDPYSPPFSPDTPGSPATSTTTNTFSSHSSVDNSWVTHHWVPVAWTQSRPSTLLDITGQSSAAFGADLGSEASRRLSASYTRLLELPFENGDLIIRLYQRQEDYRSRFFCLTRHPTRPRIQTCLPLTSLDIQRSGPFLKFLRVSRTRPERENWAFIKFDTYEKLVLFFCTFLALRSEDTVAPMGGILDSEIHNETPLFAAKIIDDHYPHALRIYQDRDSQGIRLQASVFEGDLKRVPIWTAFITYQISAHAWMSRASPYVVYLRDLQRYVFSSDYNPQIGPGGEHVLNFESSRDARDFMRIMRGLRNDDD